MSSPYQPPQEAHSVPALPATDHTGKIKTFGILHLVFGSIGLLAACCFAVASFYVGRMSEDFRDMGRELGTEPGGKSVDAEMIARTGIIMHIQERLVRSTTVALGIPALLMIVASILLLRRKPAGLAWSNCYASTSILAKLGLCLYLPMVFREVPDLVGYGSQPVDYLLAVIMCIYPALTLILLNRRGVKEWLRVTTR